MVMVSPSSSGQEMRENSHDLKRMCPLGYDFRRAVSELKKVYHSAEISNMADNMADECDYT